LVAGPSLARATAWAGTARTVRSRQTSSHYLPRSALSSTARRRNFESFIEAAHRPESTAIEVERTGETAARNAAETYCADAACLPGTAQLSTWQVQYPNRQARSVGQSAIIRKQVGAKVRGERHVYRVSEGDVCS